MSTKLNLCAAVIVLLLVLSTGAGLQPVALAEGDVERRIAEFWKRVDAMHSGDSLSSTDLGQWALNVIERDTTARITVADFRTSTAGMQAAMDRARSVAPPSAVQPPASADVERRIAEFWKRVDAMQPGDSLSSTDLGQWALNVIERDTTARIAVADFRTSTAGMQAAMDRARPGPSPSPVRSSPAPSASPAPAPLTTPSATVAPTAPPAVWRPAIGATWQWQLTGLPVDLSVEVDVYDIDAFETEASTVAALHARGRKVICYVNAGGWEDWRPDAADFPRSVIGAPLDGWPGERWLDVRQLDVLAPLMEARLDLCREKGFDAVEPDNIDGYLNATGFTLSYDDQLRYNVWLAEAAHQRGLSIGLKNDMDQIADLLPHFDWALNEQCFEYDECETLFPFISAGKAVFHVEYELSTAEFCARASELRFSSMRKGLDLDALREPCD